jgi:uncharacterized protein (TIRG00374 family)
MKKILKIILGLVGLVAALFWAVHGVPYSKIIESFYGMNELLIGSVLVLTIGNLFIRALVWKQVAGTLKPLTIKNALINYILGVFSNLFLPFKLGDVAQGYALGKNQHINPVSAVSAVLIQRVFEVSSLLLVMFIVAIVFSVPYLYQLRAMALVLILILVVSIIFQLYQKRLRIISFVQRFCARYSPDFAKTVGFILDNLIKGTSAMHNARVVIKILILSIISWGVQICMVKLTADALSIDIDFIASSVVLMIINVGLTVPMAPGNVGTFQVFGIIALSLYSVTKTKALAFSIVYQVIQGVPVIIGGIICLLIYLKKSAHIRMHLNR